MTSLLSPFHFGQKHAYFHVRITIHELVNVPLVTGHFKARWRVKNAHGLHNIPGAISPSPQGEVSQYEKDQASVDEGASDRKPLHHKKSFNSIASQDKSIKSGLSSQNDLSLQPEDEVNPRERKTSNRFLAGFKEAFHAKGRRSTSNMLQASPHEELTPDHQSSSSKTSRDQAQTEDGKAAATKKSTTIDSSRMAPKRSESVRSFAAESDNSHKRASYHSGKSREERESASTGSAAQQQASLLLHAEPRGETSSEKVREHVVKWERQLEVGVRVPIEKQRLNDKSSSHTPAATTSGALTPSGHSDTGLSSMASSSAASNRNSMSNKESAQSLKSKLSHRSLADDRRTDGDSKADRLDRENKDKDKDRELADAWGMLAATSLKIVVRGEVPTDVTGHQHAGESHITIGYADLNLAEYAPYPESSAHHHHHQRQHQHHISHNQHHHHHHHHHQQHIHHHHHVALSRTESRRYLLSESRTNATLKITIEMTHMGGSREYAVPTVRKGLVVGGVSSLMESHTGGGHSHNNNNSHNHDKKAATTTGNGSSSEGGGSTEGHGADKARGSQSESQYCSHNASISSFVQNPVSNWPANSVAKHARIPAGNLKTVLSHQDAARAVKEAGGQRMGFSFGAGAHHDRPPEDVIDALFNPGASNNANLMLSATVNRAEKVKQGGARRRDVNESVSGKHRSREGHKDKQQNERGVYAEKADHYEGLTPAEHPKDSAQSSHAPLSRLTPARVADGSRPGPDITRSRSNSKVTTPAGGPSSAETTSDEGRKRDHRRTSSNSTMRSILTNSLSSKTSLQQQAGGGGAATAGSAGSGSGSGSVLKSSESNSNSESPTATTSAAGLLPQYTRKTSYSPTSSQQQHRQNLVHWDASVTGSSSENARGSSGNEKMPAVSLSSSSFSSAATSLSSSSSSSSQQQQTGTGTLIVPKRELTSSPSLMSSQQRKEYFDDVSPVGSQMATPQASSSALANGQDKEEGSSSNSNKDGYPIDTMNAPPMTPPDVARREASMALDEREVAKEVEVARRRQGASRAARGLSKEEALQKGYRGVGWGTLGLVDPSTGATEGVEEGGQAR